MLERLKFYYQHSLNDLMVNPLRTAFVLLCITVGVTAIVGLQNLGVMIDDTLTGDLQEQNRGDIALTVVDPFGDEGVNVNEEGDIELPPAYDRQVARGVQDGMLTRAEFFTGLPEIGMLVPNAVNVLKAWGEENYDGEFDVTYASQANNDAVGIIFGTAPGSIVTNSRNNQQASQQIAVIIDVAKYPFYSEVLTVDDKAIENILRDPRNIVISEKTSVRLDAEVGDKIKLGKFTGEFNVAGIVADSSEIRDPFGDILLGVFGYYYMSAEAVAEFSDLELHVTSLYVQIDDSDQTDAVAEAIKADFAYLASVTTTDLRESNEEISDAINKVFSAIGILSLLLGSIGIINTMQVIVRRRMMEIAVLKTVGMKGRQITILFLIEALLLGVLGSALGVLFGTASILALRTVGENLTGQELEFKLTLTPILNGVIVGIVVTTVFGFLPTLTAAKVRPSIVLRPYDRVKLRSGILAILLTLLVTTIILSFTVKSVLDVSNLYAIIIVGGAFAVGAILYPILWVTIWLVGRLFPKFGSVKMDLAKTELRVGRSRSAATLLALVIGIFALSSITLFADALSSLIDELLTTSFGGRPVIVQVSEGADPAEVERIIQANDYVDDYVFNRSYGARLENITLPNGTQITRADLNELARSQPEQTELDSLNRASSASFMMDILSSVNAFPTNYVSYDKDKIIAGEALSPDTDIENPGIVLLDYNFVEVFGIEPGTQMTFTLGAGERGNDQAEVTYTVVGIVSSVSDGLEGGDGSNAFVYADTVPENIKPSDVFFNVGMPSDKVGTLQTDMQSMPDVFVFDTRIISTIIDAFIGQFAIIPRMFGISGLIVGGVVIANSVALATIERRRDIAVLKAIGLKRFGVLFTILAENALLGFVGALLGVGFGVVALIVFEKITDINIDINWTTAGILSFLCVGIAVLAAILSAWGASGERPLNVLRYE